MDLIFFGMQGAGKGTLGKAVAEKYNMKFFETGTELRKLSTETSPLAKKIQAILEAGELVSNEIVMEIVENFLNNLPNKETPVLFDGIPRKRSQGESLNTLLDKHQRKYKAVLIKISKETALKRLTTRRICPKCKAVYPLAYEKNTCENCTIELETRSDDNPDAIKKRLEIYEKETIPTLELYKNKLVEIDGEPTIEDVKILAFEALNDLMSK